MRLRKKSNRLPKARVALCDDEETVRAVFRKALERDDRFEIVAEGSNGQDALDIIAEHTPDALILDFAMPETTGVQVFGHIRERFPNLTIVVVSGFFDMEQEALAMGADAFVSKSSRVKDLVEALAQNLWPEPATAQGTVLR